MKRVRTPDGVRRYHSPIGTPIVSSVKLLLRSQNKERASARLASEANNVGIYAGTDDYRPTWSHVEDAFTHFAGMKKPLIRMQTAVSSARSAGLSDDDIDEVFRKRLQPRPAPDGDYQSKYNLSVNAKGKLIKAPIKPGKGH